MNDTTLDQNMPPQVALRPPSEIMRLERMGSFFPTRLSFLRSLLRKLAQEGVGVSRRVFNLDDNGFGHTVYEVSLDGHPYSLIAFSKELAPENRTDRVIAEAWDACFVLFDGQPTADDIVELHGHAIHQEAGQYNPRVLVLSRANKSVRLFDHVVERLSNGQQPDADMINTIGYLMRTTAVYGNGKFGLADRSEFMDRPSLSQPFRLEMLTVYLIREFTLDLVNHVAERAGDGDHVELGESVRRQLGIGNSTGLGMAPFLVSHPILINNWMLVRETALARVRALKIVSDPEKTVFTALLKQVSTHLDQWNVDDTAEQARIENLRLEYARIRDDVENALSTDYPWEKIVELSRSGGVDVQELFVALVLEPHGVLIDGLCDCMEATNNARLDPTMRMASLRSLIEEHYRWALDLDLSSDEASALVWYVSEEKLEPRLGDRREAFNERREMPHHVAHKVKALYGDLTDLSDSQLIAEFLMKFPKHRDIVRRVQTVATHVYGEIQDNLVAAGVRPIDLLRCKLSFFGASKFDPRSDRWTRITLYQGAPTARDLSVENAADVFLPAFEPVQN